MRISILAKAILVSAGLFLLLIVVLALCMKAGTTSVSIRDLFGAIGNDPDARRTWTIVFSYRLPRALLAAVAGGGLASAGVVFQGVLRNPLADPYIVGIAAGGALGAVISIVLLGEAGLMGTSACAFIGCLVAVGIVYGLATVKRGAGYVNTVILAGVIVGALMNALVLLIISVSGSHEVQRALFWLMGDLSMADYAKIRIAASFVLVGWVALYLNSNRLNLLMAGDDSAASLGLNVSRTRAVLMALAALLTGAVVSVAGTIGFVGLVVPHTMRLLFGPDNRILLPASLLGGAAFLAAADLVARLAAYPVELPVGVITALAGAPFFLYLLVSRQ